MARDIKHLAAFTRKLSKGIGREANRLKQEVVSGILVEVVTGTPVDTSLHMSNWQVGIGSAPPSGNTEPAVPGKAGSTAGASAAITIATGTSRLTTKLLGKTIYVSNESPVIEGLNDGSISDQPGGFVQKGLSKAEQIVGAFEFQI